MRKIIAANWKMNMSFSEIDNFFYFFSKKKDLSTDREVFIAPPFVYIQYVKEKINSGNLNFKCGAQNCFYEDKGAFTGEISVNMLKDLDVDFVIIGHSERRNIFNESNELLNKKVKKVLSSNLECIFCIGEKLEERENGKTFSVLETQLKQGLQNVENLDKLIIAYEPVWAIGTGKNAEKKQIEEAHTFIKDFFNRDIPILYGGSVNPENIKEILDCKNVNGVLVGGASLIAKKFYKIIKS